MQPGRTQRLRDPRPGRRHRRPPLAPLTSAAIALLIGACAASPADLEDFPDRAASGGDRRGDPDTAVRRETASASGGTDGATRAAPEAEPAATASSAAANGSPTAGPAPRPTPRADRPRRGDDTIDTALEIAFRRARDLVERESGTELSAVRLRLVDDATILGEVERETRRLVHGQLGDGPLAERLLATLVRDQAGTYAALYAGRHRSIMVSRAVLAGYLDSLPAGAAARDEALLVLMLHELVHAADDRRHGIHTNRTLDFRASFAQSAAFEGHAQWTTRKICRREGCLGGLDALDAFMFDDPGATPGRSASTRAPGDDSGDVSRTASASPRPAPVDRNLLEYSYVEGERFVAALAARPDGAALIDRLLADPPHDPLQILDPASYPDEARESRNRALLAGALGVDRPWDHPWLAGPDARVGVATSPLKGVNLRDDPSRRDAAIDGFTRLVTAMVAVQFHDEGPRARPPIEVTLMRTDRPATARLFADTLHAHARIRGSELPAAAPGRSPDGAADGPTDGAAAGRRRATLLRTTLPGGRGEVWRTAIATDGPFVVQASGRAATSAPMDDYVLGVLAALLDGEPA